MKAGKACTNLGQAKCNNDIKLRNYFFLNSFSRNHLKYLSVITLNCVVEKAFL